MVRTFMKPIYEGNTMQGIDANKSKINIENNIVNIENMLILVKFLQRRMKHE